MDLAVTTENHWWNLIIFLMSKFTNFLDSQVPFLIWFFLSCYLSTIRPITESNAPISPGSHSLRRDFFIRRGFSFLLPPPRPGLASFPRLTASHHLPTSLCLCSTLLHTGNTSFLESEQWHGRGGLTTPTLLAPHFKSYVAIHLFTSFIMTTIGSSPLKIL